MKANSNHHPSSFTKTHGKLYFNSNIVQSQKTDGNAEDDLTEFEKSDDHNFVDYMAKKAE